MSAERVAEVLAAHLHLVSWHGRHDCCKTCGSQGRNVRVDSPEDHARHLTAALAAAGLLAEPTDQGETRTGEALRAAGRRALHHDDEMPEGKAAGLWMAIVHDGDTERDEDWQEAFAIARETRWASSP